MSEIRISDFKMLGKASHEIPPPGPLTAIIISGLTEIEKTFGPVFTAKFIKYALQFEAQKIGEKTDKDIKTLNQLEEYLISKSYKYPSPYCSILYAQYKTENEFQGQTGAWTRVGHLGAIRGMSETVNSINRNVDVDSILSKLSQVLNELKLSPREWGYKQKGDGSVDLLLRKCYFLDACRQAYDEKVLKRPDRRLACSIAFSVAEDFKIATGYEWDYTLLKFNKPHCIAHCYVL
ncbi:MAG: hypothetical protein WED07_14655 [Candidatus Freyarchaeum deiterrae]